MWLKNTSPQHLNIFAYIINCSIINGMKCFMKKLMISSAAVLLTMTSCFANDMTDDYFDIAQNYYKEGDYKKALEYVNQILELENDNIKAIGFKIKLTPPTCSKALPDIDKPMIFDVPYVFTGNSTSDMYYQKGLEFYKMKDYTSAQNCLKSAIDTDSTNYRAYNTLGLVYWAENKLAEAQDAFTKSNSINKTFTVPLDNLAQIYKQQGDNEKFFNTVITAQKLNPADICAYILLGDYYKNAGDYENSLKNYREALKIDPHYYIVYFKIAKVKSDSLDFTGSNATLKYYNGINPKDDYTFYLMAKNYVYMNNFSKAKESIYRAIVLNNCREYREELGKINYQNEEIQEALDAFNSSLSANTSAEIYNYMGMCYYTQHDFNKAILNINKAISKPDSRVLYYYNLAQVYYTLKDNVNYLRYMNLVKDFQPAKWQDYIDLSGILLDSDSKNSAILVLNQGIEKYPKVKELYLEKLKIYDLTDDMQGAGQTKLEMENVFKGGVNGAEKR